MRKFSAILAVGLLALSHIAAIAQGLGPMGPGPGMPHSAGGGTYVGPTDTYGGNLVEYWGLDANQSSYRGSKAINLCLPSDTTCADVNVDASTGLVPNTVTIAGSTCNTSTVICTIKKFYGQAGVADEVQTTIANRATFVPSTIGSNPAAQTATTTFYQSTASLTVSAQPYTYVAATNRTVSPGFETVIIQQLGGGPVSVLDFNSIANSVDLYAGTATTASEADGSFHTFQGLFDPAATSITVDATVTLTSNPAGSLFGTAPVFIIGNNSGSSGTTGYFLGGGIYSFGASSGQMTTVNTNYHSRWGY